MIKFVDKKAFRIVLILSNMNFANLKQYSLKKKNGSNFLEW